MVPISRMYLGVHSANQILFGLVLGQIFLILYKYLYQKYIYFLFWSILMKHQKKRKLIIAIIIHVLALIVPIIFYKINLEQRPVP
jgi:membrane-associated phospholipid phosphatase